jgi:hypothetical protein
MATRNRRVMPPQFWKWFNEKQHEFDLTDGAVARLAGVAHSVISRARNEEQPIGHEALAKIAPVLKTPVSVAYRLAGYIESEGAPLDPLALDILAELEGKTEAQKRAALAALKALFEGLSGQSSERDRGAAGRQKRG